MSRFIRLSKQVINIQAISHIDLDPSWVHIKMQVPKTDGFYLFAFGSINSGIESIYIHKQTNPSDYQVIQDWVETLGPNPTINK
jgi:hypothetical protein